MLSRLKAFKKMNEDARVIISCVDEVPYEELIEVLSVVNLAQLGVAFADLGGGQ